MNMVLLARVTSYAAQDGEAGVLLNDNQDWGMGKGFNYALLQTGFLGAIFVVNVAQLASQVTASIFPISVINNYFMYWMLRLMLFIEMIGIVNACWPLAYLLDRAFDMKPDPTNTFKESRDGRMTDFTPKPAQGFKQEFGSDEMEMGALDLDSSKVDLEANTKQGGTDPRPIGIYDNNTTAVTPNTAAQDV